MIEVQRLTKDYGPHRAIDQISFQIQKGDVVGFLGPNGAGKSTTMKIIAGYMAPTSGEARIAGYDVFEEPLEVKKRIGYLPETPPVYDDMYVQDYLSYVARLKGIGRADVRRYVDDALEKTDLVNVRGRLIQNLSKGYKQRVGIAQALVSKPEILILDEPTVGLDPKQVAEIRTLIKALRRDHTIILSTHILSEVEATCERIIIIHQGVIVAQDTLAGLSAMRRGGRRIQLRVARYSESLQEGLKSIEGVRDVSRGMSLSDVLIEADETDSILEAISSYVVENRAGLLELQSEKANLEDIFIGLTYDQENRGAQL